MAVDLKKMKSLFLDAAEMPSSARGAFLDRACGADNTLRRQLQQLLSAHDQGSSVVDQAGDADNTPIVSSDGERDFANKPTLPDSPVGLSPGMWIGPYKLLEQIGEGGMGTVWMAEQTAPLQRLVALKVIKPGMDSARILAGFEAERQVLARMDHPNIARVFDAGTVGSGQWAVGSEEKGVGSGQWAVGSGQVAVSSGQWAVGSEEKAVDREQTALNMRKMPALTAHCPLPTAHSLSPTANCPYFVMELVKGISITAYCDQHQLTLRERLELFVLVCQAIQHAHQKGIIHRDIKPSNVLVANYDDKPVPKVIDFGVAKATGDTLTEDTVFTGFGAIVGTLQYMSPEQAVFNARDIDTRSDVYALGVLLYELLTGTTPLTVQRLKKAGLEEVLRIIRQEEPPRPSTRLSESKLTLAVGVTNRNAPPGQLAKLLRSDLDWLVMKALEKDRDRRYESANALAQDVLRYLRDEPVLACPPSVSYRLRKFAKRHKGMLAAATLLLVVLVMGMAGTVVGLVEARWGLDQAQMAQEREKDQRLEAETQRDRAKSAEQQAVANEQTANTERGKAEANEQLARKQEQAAKDSEAQVKQVLKFFGDHVLKAQLPKGQFTGLGTDVTIRDACNAVEPKIAGMFKNQPRVEASIRAVLGETYLYLKENSHAIGQLQRALELQVRLMPGHDDTLKTMNNLAIAYQAGNRWDEAIALHHETLEATKDTFGATHRRTLTSLNNLAVAYQAAGRPGDAVPLLEEALQLGEAKYGLEDQETLFTLHNLAIAYKAAGRFDEALPLSEQALGLRTKTLGEEHADTLHSMINVAAAYVAGGWPEDAVPLFEKAVRLCKITFGVAHADTLVAMGNLALAYQATGRDDLALPLLEEIVSLRQAKQSADHPDTLKQRIYLASRYQAVGRPKAALPHLEAVFNVTKTKFGDDHLETLNSLNNLALGYQAVGRFGEALALQEEIVTRSQATKGLDDPDTLIRMHNLALAFRAADRPDDAVKLLETTVTLAKAKLGDNNAYTLIYMNNLAMTYRVAGKHDSAIGIYNDLVNRRQTATGRDNPQTLTAMNNLALAYEAADRPSDAVPLFEELLDRRKAAVGVDHPETLTVMNNLALANQNAGRPKEALALLEETLLLRKTRLGGRHSDTLMSMHNLGLNLLNQAQFTSAESILRACLAIRRDKEPNSWTTFETQSLLGASLMGQKRFAEAEPLLLAGYAGLKERAGQIPPPSQVRLTEALERIVRCYELTSQADKADQWRKQLVGK